MSTEEETLKQITSIIIEESGLRAEQVINTIQLLQTGATVPFIARYRKEQTGELDELQIRNIEDRLTYLNELEDRRKTILTSIIEQEKLTPELQKRILATRLKTELEDLYLPYKPKRRTKATIARERGLEPLADLIAAQDIQTDNLLQLAADFVDLQKDVTTAEAALEGAGFILAERLADDASARAMVRRLTWQQGVMSSAAVTDKKDEVSKYEMYYNYQEPLREIPSHRMLAMRRGEKEGFLNLVLEAPREEILAGLRKILIRQKSGYTAFLEAVTEDAYKRLIANSIEGELRLQAKEQADEDAITVFSRNLRNLLLSPPAGNKRTLGIDPGLRTGSKLAVIDETGRFMEYITIYPHTGAARAEQAAKELLRLLNSHQIEMIAIGNGTAGREMEQFTRETLKNYPYQVIVVMVSEAGASVYSASDIAREEFPDLDLTARGAISIARRLQDPLAELVKVEPKSIGVGQYQHDVNQNMLKKSLDEAVESCVNFVGVDLNTASWALLSYIAGVGPALAKAIVRHRDTNGLFNSRKELLKVPRFGAKAFEQAAGFLRIRNAVNPLDNSAVHPERYQLVEQMAADMQVSLAELVQNNNLVDSIRLEKYLRADVGMPTLLDIKEELKKPGRDPRQQFASADFRDDIRKIEDLSEGMVLQGIVTNVTAFGAFVDIGVHQDGLVHISHLSNRFIKDPNDAVQAGQVVKVKVLAVDPQRKRISLSIKDAEKGNSQQKTQNRTKPEKSKPAPATGMAAALTKAGFKTNR